MPMEGNESVKSTTGWSSIWWLISIFPPDLASRQMTAEVAAGALAADAKEFLRTPECFGVLVGPQATLVRVVEGGRVGMFRRQTVADRDDDVGGGPCQPAAESVGLGDPALHVSTAVEVHHDRHRTIGLWRVHSHPHGACFRIHGPVLHARHLGGSAGHGRGPQGAERGPDLLYRQAPLRRRGVGQLLVDDLSKRRMQGH